MNEAHCFRGGLTRLTNNFRRSSLGLPSPPSTGELPNGVFIPSPKPGPVRFVTAPVVARIVRIESPPVANVLAPPREAVPIPFVQIVSVESVVLVVPVISATVTVATIPVVVVPSTVAMPIIVPIALAVPAVPPILREGRSARSNSAQKKKPQSQHRACHYSPDCMRCH